MLQPGTVCAMALPAMRIEPSGAPQGDLVAVVRAVSTRSTGIQPQPWIVHDGSFIWPQKPCAKMDDC